MASIKNNSRIITYNQHEWVGVTGYAILSRPLWSDDRTAPACNSRDTVNYCSCSTDAMDASISIEFESSSELGSPVSSADESETSLKTSNTSLKQELPNYLAKAADTSDEVERLTWWKKTLCSPTQPVQCCTQGGLSTTIVGCSRTCLFYPKLNIWCTTSTNSHSH